MADALVVRHPQLVLAPPGRGSSVSAIPRHWHADGAFATHFYDALSSTFPFGEAFFVRSVLAHRDHIEDPDLLRRIRAFAGQEGEHSRLHDQHVGLLLAAGDRLIGRRNAFLDRVLRLQNRHVPALALAITAALEHLTAILARQVLADDARATRAMDPALAPLWRWHALEEAEHKAVAFDVLMQVAPSRLRRIAAMAIATFFLALETLLRTAYLLARDRLLFDRPTWRAGRRFLFGEKGLLVGTGADYRAWYRRDFHPDAVDDAALIAHFAARVEREIGEG